MKRISLALILMLGASTAFAQTVAFAPGQTLTVSGKADVVISFTDGRWQVVSVSNFTQGNVPIVPVIPGPIVPGNPSPTSAQRIKAIGDASKAVNDPQGAQAIAGMAMAISDAIKTGQVTSYQQLESAFTSYFDLIQAQGDRGPKWKATRDIIQGYWVRVTQEGGGLPAYRALLDDVVVGVGGQNFEAEAIDFTALTEILTIILKPDKTIVDWLRIATLFLRFFA